MPVIKSLYLIMEILNLKKATKIKKTREGNSDTLIPIVNRVRIIPHFHAFGDMSKPAENVINTYQE